MTLRSRWVVVPAALALLVGAWNGYVALNANGVIEGRVVDPAGHPVAGATVTLFSRSFITSEPRGHAVTDAEGRFRFTDNASHAVALQATAEAFAPGPRVTVRLWFRAQDTSLPLPLVLRRA
jgi:hypothetical protein